jgi:hypothetical protein
MLAGQQLPVNAWVSPAAALAAQCEGQRATHPPGHILGHACCVRLRMRWTSTSVRLSHSMPQCMLLLLLQPCWATGRRATPTSPSSRLPSRPSWATWQRRQGWVLQPQVRLLHLCSCRGHAGSLEAAQGCRKRHAALLLAPLLGAAAPCPPPPAPRMGLQATIRAATG